MGRWAVALAPAFADAVGVRPTHRVLDVGCGPGALTGVLADRVGAERVRACDPSAPFAATCARRNPGVAVEVAAAESLPYDDGAFDVVLAQLVVHFVDDPAAAAAEITRVLRPGGTFAASVWDFARGMQMLRLFWDAALTVDGQAPDEARTMSFGEEGELSSLLQGAGFTDVREDTLRVASTYAGFDELWAGFLGGVGPAGTWCVSLPEDRREVLRRELRSRLGDPPGAFTLDAVARFAQGVTPG
ncbi:class I SAM-dependent methyltransferase [Nocardioides euryhalodurans]|uniref:Class I SAM-dependent methyltransferase n=2 Tax=Nocardioides euryhalodurans TaxID=2518370 RepID=A0A4P7GQD3_9ACTN|nr:class I SAM-dependent methyltransferase [Nocardioides euryhalodurans]